MSRSGRPPKTLEVTPSERAELLDRLAVRKAPADEKLRIRIVLGCADGISGTVLAQRLHVTAQTVSKWRQRYEAYRLAGLTDAPRAGRPRTVSDEQVQAVVDRVRQSTPDERHALERSQHEQGHWRVGPHGAAHLACVWLEAAPAANVQTLHRSALRGQGA